jgi:hypothetical protein
MTVELMTKPQSWARYLKAMPIFHLRVVKKVQVCWSHNVTADDHDLTKRASRHKTAKTPHLSKHFAGSPPAVTVSN